MSNNTYNTKGRRTTRNVLTVTRDIIIANADLLLAISRLLLGVLLVQVAYKIVTGHAVSYAEAFVISAAIKFLLYTKGGN